MELIFYHVKNRKLVFSILVKKSQSSAFYQPHWIQRLLYSTSNELSRPKHCQQGCYSESQVISQEISEELPASRKIILTLPIMLCAVTVKAITACNSKNNHYDPTIVSLAEASNYDKSPLAKPAQYRTDKETLRSKSITWHAIFTIHVFVE